MERITFNNYRDYDAINYSKLKALASHPKKVDQEVGWSEGLEFGDALDLLVFSPESFDENYFVADLDNLPSDRIKGIIEDVVERHGEEITDETVLAAADRDEYGTNWNNDTRLRKILEEGDGARYASMLINAQGKNVISIEKHMELVQAAETLKEHPYTGWLISKPTEEGVERFTQFPILSFGNPLFKGLLDLMIVDHNQKMIMPWDLKNTGMEVQYFDSQFIKYKYYLQAALYTYILQLIVEEASEGTPVEEFMPFTFNPAGYKVMNFGFIVIGSGDTNNPMRWICSDEDLYSGLHGGELRSGKPVKGALELAHQLEWHQQTGHWDYPYEVYANQGELRLDVFS